MLRFHRIWLFAAALAPAFSWSQAPASNVSSTDVVVKVPLSRDLVKKLADVAQQHGVTVKKTFSATGTEVWQLPTAQLKPFFDGLAKVDERDPLRSTTRSVNLIDGNLRNLFSRISPSLTTEQRNELKAIASQPSVKRTFQGALRRDNLTAQLMRSREILIEPTSTMPTVPQAREAPIDLNVIPGAEIEAEPVSITDIPGGGSLWTARISRPNSDDRPKETGIASITIKGQNVSGVVAIGGEVYSIHPLPDGVFTVAERQRDGVDHPKVKPADPAKADEPEGEYDIEPSPIRVMVLYTAKVAARSKTIADEMRAMIGATNTSFKVSGIPNVSLELTNAQLTKQQETDDIVSDAKALMARVNSQGDILYRMRKATNTNVVVLIADYEFPRLPCGWSPMIRADAQHAVAAVSYECLYTNFAFAHELGHIFGARHDKAEDPKEPYAYGHGFTNVNHWRTIMAYPSNCDQGKCPRIPYWANPNVRYPADNVPLGTIDSEFDARVIKEQAVRVGRLRNW